MTTSAADASPSPSATPALVAMLQAALDAENAAIYGYSVAGAHLENAQRRLAARSDYDTHREQAAAVAGWMTERGLTPSPPATFYAFPAPITDAASAAQLLAQLEESAAARYADLVGGSSGSLQHAAALALQSAAVREARWRGSSVPFPGLVGRLATQP
jgi:Domain of unknown function (DUF4439)